MAGINLYVVSFNTFATKKTADGPLRKKVLDQAVAVQACMERNPAFWAVIQIFQRQFIRIIHQSNSKCMCKLPNII